jgi:type III secretion protein HrpB1
MNMSQQREAYRDMSAEVIGGLFQVVIVALREARSTYGRIDLDEVEAVLEMHRSLWPSNPEVSFFRGILEVTKTHWREAADIFLALVTASQCLPRSRAMLAYALRSDGDPDWRAEAEALRECSEPNTRFMVCSLIAQDELERAIEHCDTAGAQQMAAQAHALTERLREEANAAPSAETHVADKTVGSATRPRTQPAVASDWTNYRLRV